jgi:hypothetical protein
MSGFKIRKAKRSAAKARVEIVAPSGGGKTWSALWLAKGLGGRCVVIDTEQGSSDLYEHLHEFDVVDLAPPFTPERYIEALKECEDAGYEVVIIDSITHEWSGKGGCLELVDELAKSKYRGNTWSAYSEVTPRHRSFFDAMLRSKCHIIATARSKTETAQVDEGGRKKVVKLGMKAEQRDGGEYEFLVVFDLVHDGHYATVSKDRTGLFTGDPKPITVETGRRLAEWLAGAEPVATPPAQTPSVAREPRPADAEKPLVDVIRDSIATATSDRTLRRIVKRLDELVAEDQVTADQWSELTDAANARLASLTGEVASA